MDDMAPDFDGKGYSCAFRYAMAEVGDRGVICMVIQKLAAAYCFTLRLDLLAL